jgi:predicted transcriptional regulator
MDDPIKVLEKQSGFLRLIVYLSDNAVTTVTKIIEDTGIPVHQLYSSIEKGKELKIISSRIDNTKYPPRNMIFLTDKGKKISEKIKEISNIINSI